MDSWHPDFVSRSPVLRHLRDAAGVFAGGNWPTLEHVSRVLDEAGIRTANGRILQPVTPDDRGYESRIYERGELGFREHNWHDLFNVLTWLTFPRSKAAMNARHYAALPRDAAVNGHRRGALRDALTLLDESGLIVVSSNPGLLQMIREFRWKPLFWERRQAVLAHMHFLPFGHALCEKALDPYIGMTAHGLLLDVDAGYFELPAAERLARIDLRVAQLLDDQRTFQATTELSPVPLLGIPGWHDDNRCAGFYDNHGYFRPGRRAALSGDGADRDEAE